MVSNLIDAVLDGHHHLLLLDAERHEPDQTVVGHLEQVSTNVDKQLRFQSQSGIGSNLKQV
jgi:hypothetical protein